MKHGSLSFSGIKRLFLLLFFTIMTVSNCSDSNNSGTTTDSVPPQNITISINSGATDTTLSSVTLAISATDNVAVTGYYVSESSTAPAADAAWVAIPATANYQGSISFDLSAALGTKTVYIWFKDSSSNISVAASAAIQYVFVAKGEVSSPKIIMIVIDTLRYDHLSDSGYARDTSPNLSEFADSAVVFSNAIAPAPWTLPSYTSILLGKHAFNHNMNIPPDISGGETTVNGTMLPKKLKDAGYYTVSIQTNLFSEYFAADFEEKYSYFDSSVYYQDGLAIDKALGWVDVDTNINKDFFLFIGLFSPHLEYKTNNGYLEGFVMDDLYKSQTPVLVTIQGGDAIIYSDLSSTLQGVLGEPQNSLGYYQDSRLYIAAYDSEIKYADYQIGRLLQKLKDKNLFDDAIIIITADHGENMVDHLGYFSHGNNLFNSLVHVPLMIKFPRQKTRMDITSYVRTIDILPSVFDYLSLDTGDIDGKSLIPIINQDYVDYDERPVISYREDVYAKEKAVSVIRDDYKLIKNVPGDQLFSLKDDPFETTDVAAQKADLVNSLNDLLSQFYQY